MVRKELEKKRERYREWIKQNPLPFDEEIEKELKECEGCYCQKPSDSSYDFCFDCLDCDTLNCGEYDPWTGNCCACYGTKNKKLKLERKKLSFTQRQRLHWEQVKKNAEDKIEDLKLEEDKDDMLTAKRIEDTKRWTEQNKRWTLKNLTLTELYQEIEKRKSPPPKEPLTDQNLLKELVIRIKKGCIEIKKTKDGLVLKEECRWDLEPEEKNYQVSLSELMTIQKRLQKLEAENKLCNICLEREKEDSIFCKPCGEREVKQSKERSKELKNLIK